MAKTKTAPTGFNAVLDGIYGNEMHQDEATVITDEALLHGSVEDIDDNIKPVEPTEDIQKADDTEVNTNNDSDIPEDVLNRMNGTTNEPPVQDESLGEQTNDEPTTDDVNEAQQIGLLFDAIGESFGWNMGDIEEQDRPMTVDDLTNYMREVVEQNSIPQYADERIQKLDEYVKNGGKFEDFYGKQQQELSYDSLDMEDESNQKAVVSELLKYSGYTDEQIKNKINRYEDADMLQDESAEALDRLKQIKQREIEYAQQQQAEILRQQEAQSQKFYQDCLGQINSLTSIRGVQIPKEDRARLADYIFNVDQNGVSKFQKDYNSSDNFINNLITTAYMTMKGDSFISTAKRDGESSAAEKLRKMLRHQTRNHSTFNADEKPKSVVDLASRYF